MCIRDSDNRVTAFFVSTLATAALAALLPNTFLQALVWRTLTTPEAELLPEVTEHESV